MIVKSWREFWWLAKRSLLGEYTEALRDLRNARLLEQAKAELDRDGWEYP